MRRLLYHFPILDSEEPGTTGKSIDPGEARTQGLSRVIKDFREVAAPGFDKLVPIFSCFHRLKYLNLISTPLTLRLFAGKPSVHLLGAARTLDFGLGALNAEEWLLRDCTLYQSKIARVPQVPQPNAETKPAPPCHVIPGFITASVFLEANH